VTDTLELDWESFSPVDLTKLGLDLYSAHPKTEILMGAYALNGSKFRLWEAHKGPPPRELVEALEDPEVEKWAFNAQFERIMARRTGLAKTPRKGWRCTAVLAGLAAFNGPLGEVGERLGLSADKQKDKRGKQLIQTFSMPQRITKANPHVRRDWRTNPVEWEEFGQYCVQDGYSERPVRQRLLPYFPDLSFEWELYELDQEINDRGLPVDLEFCRQAIAMSNRRKEELTSEMRRITGLANPGSVSQLLPWLQDRGYPFKDLQKANVAKAEALNVAAEETLLEGDAPKVLELRKWQARLSVRKYDALMNTTGKGDSARFLYQMAGAGRTGRWAGRRVQAQNLARTPKSLEGDVAMETANRLIRTGDYDGLSLYMGEPMEALVGCVRSAFRAKEGEEFRVADLASIETAVIALLAGCEPLLDVFREGRDPYKDFATHFYGKAYDEVTKAERGICKPPMLGCGYRLGGGTLIDGQKTGLWGYAENMGVNMTQAEAHRGVKVYRATYPEVPEFWKRLEVATERAMDTKREVRCGLLRFQFRSPFLLMYLPTGRPIFYYRPKMELRKVPTGEMIEKRARGWDLDGAPEGEKILIERTWTKRTLTYLGKHQKTGQWVRMDTHGGKTTEQATQATAREVLAIGMVRAKKDGFLIAGHSHDETISVAPVGDNYHTWQRLAEVMTQPIDCLPGLPLGAAGFSSPFYKKD
jgi:DNA polymerase